jgi:RNA polymerase sigma factor (sigma-70 family)
MCTDRVPEQDQAALLAALVEKYSKSVNEFCRMFARNSADLEELTKETLRKAITAIENPRDSKAVRQCLMRTFREVSVSYMVRKRSGAPAGKESLTDEAFESGIRRMVVALSKMPKQDRYIWILCVRYDRSVAKVAQFLGIDEKAVHGHLARVLSKLFQSIEEKQE